MSGPSVAQYLPLHIVEAIVNHAQMTYSDDRRMHVYSKFPQIPKPLLPFMNICQSWRHATCPLFYRSALLLADGENCRAFTWGKPLEMQHLVSNNQQHYVREVHIHVNAATFNLPWCNDRPTIDSKVGSCDRLQGVRSIHLWIDFKWHTGTDTICDSQQLVQNISTLSQAIYEKLPRARQIYLDSKMYHSLDAREQIEKVFLQHLGMVITENTINLTLSTERVCKNISIESPLVSLRELTLVLTHGCSAITCLVQRCAESLEKLHVKRASTLNVLELIWASRGETGQTCVYPRLKHFYVHCKTYNGESTGHQPLVDPFPQLETLSCKGEFPFTTSVVLNGGRSHIRHLDIGLDIELYTTLVDEQVFAQDAFPNLHFVSIDVCGFIDNTQNVYPPVQSLELCRAIRTARLESKFFSDIERIVPIFRSLTNLQILDIGCVLLGLDESMEILCACPCLEKANISLESRTVGMWKTEPVLTTIRHYREKYSAYTSSVRYLGIERIQPYYYCKVPGYIVMLTDILRSVVRVCYNPSGRQAMDPQLLEKIEKATRKPIYKLRPHVRNVKYFINSDW